MYMYVARIKNIRALAEVMGFIVVPIFLSIMPSLWS